MVVNPKIIILNQLYPSTLSQIQVILCEYVFETLVVTVYLTLMSNEIMPPYHVYGNSLHAFLAIRMHKKPLVLLASIRILILDGKRHNIYQTSWLNLVEPTMVRK
jgi:hypothetical protein